MTAPSTSSIRLRPNLPFSRSMPLPVIEHGDAMFASLSSPPPELVAGLIHESTKAVFAGSSKAGKTWILSNLAVSVATGTPFLHWKTNRSRVLYINLEIDRSFFTRRIESIRSARGLESVGDLDVWNLRGHSTSAKQLIGRILEGDYRLVVIDPIYKLITGISESSQAAMSEVCSHLDQIVAGTGATVVYAHHFSKGAQGAKRSIDRMSGSGVFARDADTVVTLTEHTEPGCLVVESTLRNLPPAEPFVMQLDVPLMHARMDLDPEDLAKGAPKRSSWAADRILQLVEGTGITGADWERLAAGAGVPRATFFRARRRLELVGAVIQDPETKLWTKPGTSGCRTEAPEQLKSETDETETDGIERRIVL